MTTATSQRGELSDVLVPVGGIAWNEYAASDVTRAKQFLCGLFGWSSRSKEFGFEGAYVTLTCAGRDVVGLLSMGDLLATNQQAGWFPVIRVGDVDAATARACELGAVVLAPPVGLKGLGRHAMLAGPSQGRMAFLDAMDDHVPRGAGYVGWNELRVTQPSATALFMWKAFGWQAESQWDEEDGLIPTFLLGGQRIASMRKLAAGKPSQCLPCIEVADVDATLRLARELGGTVAHERADDPILGHAARLADPLGVELVVYRR